MKKVLAIIVIMLSTILLTGCKKKAIDASKFDSYMKSNLSTDYSTLALRMLANGGYLYRGNPINYNMGIGLPF